MIYVFLANGFEEVEALTPVDMLRRCELEVVTAGVGGRSVRGSHGVAVTADIDAADIVLDGKVDMIVLPGGMPGTLNLEKNADVNRAIDHCLKNDRYIAAICAAPSILGHLGLLRGKTATCFPGFEQELEGAAFSSAPVCTDGRIITSRGAGTAMDFALELVKVLISGERAELLKGSVVYGK